jgi:cell volume regulation protein A
MVLLYGAISPVFTNITLDNILLIGSVLLFLSLLASRTTKFGIPTLLLFLLVGMLAGQDGPGGIVFNDPKITKFIGAIALSFILFSGGLDTRKADIRPVLWHGISLSTAGVVLSTVLIGVFVSLVTRWTLLEGLLLGAIVSSTDAAAVFSILRSRSIGLKGHLKPLLELESGSNDPMAYILTIAFTYLLVEPSASASSMIALFFKQMILGAVVGYGMGIAMHRIINWIRLEFEGLYSVLLITLVLLVFSFTDFIGGNAFLAVYLSGVVLGNRDFIHKKSLTKHFDGQAWMMQIIMFITLGLLVNPKGILPYVGLGLLFSAFLILIARPVSVFITLAAFKMNNRERFFISWVGLRGAVPIVLATYPLIAGVDKSMVIFNLVFFISVTSVLIQGTSLPIVAKWLKLTVPVSSKKKSVLDLEQAWETKSIYKTIIIEPHFSCVGKSIVDLKLPSNIIIALIERHNKFFITDGATRIHAGDAVYVMADDATALEQLNACLNADEKHDRFF